MTPCKTTGDQAGLPPGDGGDAGESSRSDHHRGFGIRHQHRHSHQDQPEFRPARQWQPFTDDEDRRQRCHVRFDQGDAGHRAAANRSRAAAEEKIGDDHGPGYEVHCDAQAAGSEKRPIVARELCPPAITWWDACVKSA